MSNDAGISKRKSMTFNHLILFLSCQFFLLYPVSAYEDRPLTKSGETQVVAKLGKREITISELRTELIRLGMTTGTAESQRFALQSIINRHLLVGAARKASVHRDSDAVLRIRAAQDQALADYYLANVTQPVEPTLNEIEDYIAENPSLFAQRTRYQFTVLSLKTNEFNDDVMTPLFSETVDYSALIQHLNAKNIKFRTTPLEQVSSSFPKDIRKQLSRYKVNDNIVIKSNEETQIMKINQAEPDLLDKEEWLKIARRLVMDENAIKRARTLLDSLKLGSSVTYFHKDLAPVEAANNTTQNTKNTAGK